MAHIFSGRKSAEEIVSVCLPFTKKVQIVHRLLLVNYILLHVLLDYVQPANNVEGLAIH